MIHEFAHSLLHKQTDKNSNQREIEAEFSFKLYEANAEFVVSGAVIQTKENTAEGAVTFDELTYEEAGTWAKEYVSAHNDIASGYSIYSTCDKYTVNIHYD